MAKNKTDGRTYSLETPENRQKFKLMIDEIVAAKRRQDTEKEQIKEIRDQIKAMFAVKPKIVQALVNAAYKCDFNEVRDEYNEIVELYEAVMVV